MRQYEGFTLLEMTLVLVVIALLTAFMAANYINLSDDAKLRATISQGIEIAQVAERVRKQVANTVPDPTSLDAQGRPRRFIYEFAELPSGSPVQDLNVLAGTRLSGESAFRTNFTVEITENNARAVVVIPIEAAPAGVISEPSGTSTRLIFLGAANVQQQESLIRGAQFEKGSLYLEQTR